MPDEKRPLKVFLCHASADKPKVRELYRRLVHDGIDVWLDEAKLLPGMEWQLEIPGAVREADAIIICLSNNSVTKEGYVQKEIRFALDIADEKPEGTIYLIPVRLEECAVPSRLVRWQWVDLFTSDGYRKLRRSLRLRADAVGAGFSSASRQPETENHRVQVNPNSTESSAGDEEYTFNFGLTIRLFAVLTLVILICAGIFGAVNWLARGPAAQTPSSTPTLPPAASSTPEPPVTAVPFPPTSAPPSPIPIETVTPFLPPTLPNLPAPTATPVLVYIVVSPTPQPTATDPMVLIPAGSFMMGSDTGYSDEKPAHKVDLDAFYIYKYEVTNRVYSRCVESGVCKRAIALTSNTPNNYDSDEKYYFHPVVNVSWQMAKTYCEWRGARLPTEAEWERAARGGLQGALYPWGNTEPVCTLKQVNGAQFANCKESDAETSNPVRVGSFKANGYGLFDMLGNVSEWVNDWYADNYYQASNNSFNPTGPLTDTLRVLRGGSWSQKNIITVSSRGREKPETQSSQIGFRCAGDAQP